MSKVFSDFISKAAEARAADREASSPLLRGDLKPPSIEELRLAYETALPVAMMPQLKEHAPDIWEAACMVTATLGYALGVEPHASRTREMLADLLRVYYACGREAG